MTCTCPEITSIEAAIVSFSRTKNLASVFVRLTGRYLAAALSFSLILKIGPTPTPGTPGFNWTRRASRLCSHLSRWRSKQSGPRVILEKFCIANVPDTAQPFEPAA